MIYKGVDYEKEGTNPFYYMSYIDPKWYFDDTIIIHPKCKEIMDEVCDDFCDITKIVFPQVLIKIGERSFRGCRDLKKIILKDGLKYIEKEAFLSCSQVGKIELPASIKKLGEACFMHLDNLDVIRYHGSLANWHKVKKEKNWFKGDMDFYVICDDDKEHLVSKSRYYRFDDKERLFNKGYINDEIKEIVSLPMNEKIKRARGMFDTLFSYLANERRFEKEDRINYLVFGFARLFISTTPKFKKVYYQRFLKMTGIELSYKDFYELMTKRNDIAEKAFDLITCDLPISKRLIVAVVGSAIISENKRLNWKARHLVDDIMGPLE